MALVFLSTMDYQQTLDYLFSRLPQFSRVGAAAYKADLTNTRLICDALGNPQTKFKSIHVAGTNGKGSVSHMLASILQSAGYKTGLYTSPHLKDFRERIKINGKEITQDFVIDFTGRVKQLVEEIQPSFFEITVGMAFEWFSEQKVDVAVIETGLGGRLDSTNIITPELSVITNIGMDHMNFLGDTLEKIAEEKAGIIKESIPVVIGEFLPETETIFSRVAAEKNAPVSFASKKRQAMNWYWAKNSLCVEVSTLGQTDHKIYQLDLTGIYQVKNLLTVLEACSVLHERGWLTEDANITMGLKQTRKTTGLHGRWEIIQTSPTVVVDVAHNPDGAKQLANQIELTDHNELHIIIGLVKDKSIEAVLNELPREATYYFTQANIPRALPAEELAEKANGLGLTGKIWRDVNQAISAALDSAADNDLVVVCGSIFLAGEINRH